MATSSTSGVLLSTSSMTEYKEQIDKYLASYRTSLETSSLSPLNARKDTYTSQSNALSSLATKLTSLQATLKLLSNTGSDSIFNSFSPSINTVNYVNPILTGTLSAGNYSIFVNQLAKNDKVMTDSVSQTGTNVIAAGDHEFTVKVGSSEFAVNVSIEAGESNSSILDKIANAINSSASTKVSASLINDTDNTTKLVLSSKETGTSNAISFIDGDTNLLASLGIGSTRTAASGTSGGYVNADLSELDAIVNIDGINITRGSNNIAGVIPGLTLELKAVNQPSDGPTNLVISPGRDNVKSLLDKFMEDYNDVVKYLNEQMKITSAGRSIFSGDMMLRSFNLQMRSLLNQTVGSVAPGAPSSLFSIGIKINSDGTLAWDNITKFNQAFEKGASNIADIFNSVNGISNNLNKYLDNYTKSGGILYNKSLSIQTQIKYIEASIASTKLRIDKKVEKVTNDYNKLLSSIVNLQNQQEMMKQAQNMYY